MKIYEDRKMNGMYLLHNMQRVGDLKEDMEIMISTEDVVYFTDTPQINKFSEDYPIDNIVPLIKKYEPDAYHEPIEYVMERISKIDNLLGSNTLHFKTINGIKCLMLTLSNYMVNNLKAIYNEDDYIVFDNLTLTKFENRNEDGVVERVNVKTLAVLPQITKMHTEEELNNFYFSVIDMMLAKEDTVNRLLSGEEVPNEHGRIFTKNGMEDVLEDLLEIIFQLKKSEDKLLTLKIIFSSYNKTPFKMLKLIGVNLNNIENAMLTRTFS